MEQDISQQILAELKDMRQGIQKLEQKVQKLDKLEQDIADLQEEQAKQGSKLSNLSKNVEHLREDMEHLREDVEHLRQPIVVLEHDQKQILRALGEDEVYKRELLQGIKPRVDKLEERADKFAMDISALHSPKKAKAK